MITIDRIILLECMIHMNIDTECWNMLTKILHEEILAVSNILAYSNKKKIYFKRQSLAP